jgi:hypothetical protein
MLAVRENYAKEQKGIKTVAKAIEFLPCAGKEVDGQELEVQRGFLGLKKDK